MTITRRPYLLHNPIQPYAWGARGNAALIPQLLGIPAAPEQPYAELWIGAHPAAPSTVLLDGDAQPLQHFIAAAPGDTLGARVAARFASQLPFLLKVLSAARPLSIQAHPTREQAARLHHQESQHYPDSQHKPELAIAIDQLDALVGFRPFPELRQVLLNYPELSDFIGPACYPLAAGTVEDARAALRASYIALATRAAAAPDALTRACAQLAERLRRQSVPPTAIEQLFLELHPDYPRGDVGLLLLFLLNQLHLRAGEGLFTEAGVLHAYLRGNIVECMANSDNVLRAGLTTKFTNAQQLADILTYAAASPDVLRPAAQAGVTHYPTPAAEFAVSRWQLPPDAPYPLTGADSPELLLVLRGEVTIGWGQGAHMTLQRGQSVFVPAVLSQYTLQAGTSGVDLVRVLTPED